MKTWHKVVLAFVVYFLIGLVFAFLTYHIASTGRDPTMELFMPIDECWYNPGGHFASGLSGMVARETGLAFLAWPIVLYMWVIQGIGYAFSWLAYIGPLLAQLFGSLK